MPVASQVSASDYCRRARRLRGALAGQPGRLHARLRELAAKHGGPAERTPPRAIPARARGFADEVAASLEGPVLRYSQRRCLMLRARELGIGDFEANLVIAAVQHERRGSSSAPASRVALKPRPRLTCLAPLAVVIAVESLVGLGIWHVCFG
jgi:hypothetical protein